MSLLEGLPDSKTSIQGNVFPGHLLRLHRGHSYRDRSVKISVLSQQQLFWQPFCHMENARVIGPQRLVPRFQKAAKTWQGAKGLKSLKGGPEKPLSETVRRKSQSQWRPGIQELPKLSSPWKASHRVEREQERGPVCPRWEEPEEKTTQGSRAQIPGTKLQGSASAHLDFGLALTQSFFAQLPSLPFGITRFILCHCISKYITCLLSFF